MTPSTASVKSPNEPSSDDTNRRTEHDERPSSSCFDFKYQTGFHNTFQSEAAGYENRALPIHRNNPRICPLNLYAEQLSGTAFTVPRNHNYRTWLYRRLPSCAAPKLEGGGEKGDSYGDGDERLFRKCSSQSFFGHCDLENDLSLDPNPMRWMPPRAASSNKNANSFGIPPVNTDFVEGTYTMAASGHPAQKNGLAIHIYNFNSNMRHINHSKCNRNQPNKDANIIAPHKYMYNSDGDFLIVPQHSALFIETEMGHLIVRPREICVIPRGIVFSVNIHDDDENENDDDGIVEIGSKSARGYILEIYQGHFDLPNLGLIGSNGLANARDFLIPTAAFDHDDTKCPEIPSNTTSSSSSSSPPSPYHHHPHVMINKFGNELFEKTLPPNASPFNVVAWHGNYVPFKYNLNQYCAMNSVTYDHPDPSIYTVLTVPSCEEGTALADFGK